MKKDYIGIDLSTITFKNINDSSIITRRASVITQEEALDIGKRFAAQVRAKVDPDARIFAFGSIIKGNAGLESDIDIAVVSKVFDGDYFREAGRVSGLAQSVSWDIEVHAVTGMDWTKDGPHVSEIKKWGIEI